MGAKLNKAKLPPLPPASDQGPSFEDVVEATIHKCLAPVIQGIGPMIEEAVSKAMSKKSPSDMDLSELESELSKLEEEDFEEEEEESPDSKKGKASKNGKDAKKVNYEDLEKAQEMEDEEEEEEPEEDLEEEEESEKSACKK